MKSIATMSLLLALSASALAQSSGMQGMDMKDCKGMEGMNMKNMDMSKCKDMMNSRDSKPSKNAAKEVTHHATGVVKKIDMDKGTVTLAHGPVDSLKWPAMTMSFAVEDKKLFDKLAVDKKVDVELKRKGSDYIVTAVK